MPAVSSRRGARFEVRFDDLSFEEDLARATRRGRDVAVEARERLEREGADPSELLRCQPEHRDGTQLPNCVKAYLPPPDGRWGMVFELLRDRSTGKLVLVCLAFAERHPNPRRALDVYQRAHERLHSARGRKQ